MYGSPTGYRMGLMFLGAVTSFATGVFQERTKDSFITQDRNEQIKGVKVEATFSRGHISLI